MLATLVGNGAAWSVATLPAIKAAVGTFRTYLDVRVESVMRSKAEASCGLDHRHLAIANRFRRAV